MRRLPCLLILCLLSLPAWAGVAGQASVRRAGQDVAVVRVRQQVEHSRARVTRLQQGVAKQESLSREAAARLQQKNDTIAELERQLQALQSGQKASRDGH